MNLNLVMKENGVGMCSPYEKLILWFYAPHLSQNPHSHLRNFNICAIGLDESLENFDALREQILRLELPHKLECRIQVLGLVLIPTEFKELRVIFG